MESRISMIALGVRDLPRSVKFYGKGLGFLPSSASNDSIAFFKTGGTVLALYPWDKLAEDAQVPDEGHGFRGVTLAHNVRERKEVGEVLALAAASGGKIIKPAQDVFWGGHSGYFADSGRPLVGGLLESPFPAGRGWHGTCPLKIEGGLLGLEATMHHGAIDCYGRPPRRRRFAPTADSWVQVGITSLDRKKPV